MDARGNGRLRLSRRVFVSYATEDAAICEALVALLREWGTECWFDQRARTGGPVSDQAQQALTTCDVFLRICTADANHSYWMDIESAAVLSLEAEAHRATGRTSRLLINLLIDDAYRRMPFDTGTTFIDVMHLPPAAWVGQLRQALDLLPLSAEDAEAASSAIAAQARAHVAARRARLTRRRLLRGGAAAAAVVLAAAGSLAYIETRPRPLRNFSDQPTPPARGKAVAWHFTTGNEVYANPKLDGTTLYVSSLDGTVYALDVARQGALRWKFSVAGALPLYSEPVVANGLVYAVPRTRIAGDVTSIYAVDATTGAARWSQSAGLLYSYTPVAANGRLFTEGNGYTPSLIAVRDARTGTPITVSETRAHCLAAPTLANGVLYVLGLDTETNFTSVYALRASDMSVLWQTQVGTLGGSQPTVGGGRVFVGSADAHLYCLDVTSGHVLWKYPASDRVYGTPLVTSDTIYFGADDSYIYALDSTSGTTRWKLKTGGAVRGQPVLDGGALFVSSFDHTVYALDPATGVVQKTYTTNGQVHSHPLVTPDMVYVSSSDRNVYAFHR